MQSIKSDFFLPSSSLLNPPKVDPNMQPMINMLANQEPSSFVIAKPSLESSSCGNANQDWAKVIPKATIIKLAPKAQKIYKRE